MNMYKHILKIIKYIKIIIFITVSFSSFIQIFSFLNIK
jgi:hypothetical protein